MTEDKAERALNALANRIELQEPYVAKSSDGAEWERIVINVSLVERDRIVAAIRANAHVRTEAERTDMARADMARRLRECNWNDAADMIEALRPPDGGK